MEKQALELYKEFIDDLVELRPCVLPRWITGNGWPKTVENEKINKVLSELTTEQKEVVALIAQSARDGGIHDVLVYLTDQINLEGLEIVKNDVKMATDPFDSGMHYDWVCRREGDSWPDQNR
ncbi:DUF6547 family protein [Paenibacillus sp. PAMC21692]|uniref:DUF6547 family protein n=1 Tax=Paenibacillus sp. PAMC21692 TaxID=2762320 RepID=UPI00164D03E1|nr:DUF6547 family protein [Paenibacillus sp. PAMC21692]QNK54695.1 hypothetical protein H7F31_18795 [Paenibacillus sp. PAMC21692]